MGDKTKNFVPQVGSGSSGESHSSLMGDCPVDSGGDNQPLATAPAQVVGDQATQAVDMTGSQKTSLEGEEDKNPFKRRDSIPRSPPVLWGPVGILGRQRSGSCSNAIPIAEANANKRKREEPTVQTPNMTEVQEFLDLLNKLNEDTNALRKEIEKTYKPKEFKNLASSIVLWTKELEKRAQELLGKELKDQSGVTASEKIMRLESQQQRLERENKYLQQQIEDIRVSHKKELVDLMENTKEVGSQVQCEECKKARKKKARRHMLARAHNFENFQEITEEDWKDEVFPRLKTKEGHIWEAPSEYTLILPCNKGITSSHMETKRAIENFGGQEGLKKQDKKKGEAATMIHSLGYPEEDGNYKYTSREIYYPILSDGGINEEVEDGNVFQALKTVKTQMLNSNKSKLALPEIDGIMGVVIARMLRFLFDDTNVEIVVYKPSHDQSSGKGLRGPIKSGSSNTTGGANPNARIKKPKPEALLIKMGGKTYSDLLKTMKQTVNPNQIGVDIKEIRKTKNGELLITLQNGVNKAEVLKKEITKKIPGVTAALLTNKKVLHIKDLDEVATEEEIREAISRSISVQPETFEIRALRPAYASKQNCTIVMKATDAEKLIQMNKIKIGWTNCRIVERKQETKCFRCWKQGHTKEQCTGPDRGNVCLKCGKEGHKVAECRNKAYCVFCKAEGHQSGSKKCPKNGDRHSQGADNQ